VCCALIALYKLVKVLLLLLVAYGELRLRDASLVAKLLSWASGAALWIGTPHRDLNCWSGSAA
jgi:hypothetical protein